MGRLSEVSFRLWHRRTARRWTADGDDDSDDEEDELDNDNEFDDPGFGECDEYVYENI